MSAARATAILVHGLWMHGAVMGLLSRYLERLGFEVVCYSYPSVRLNLTENADRLGRFARTLEKTRIHWVGHSLGAILILRMLERDPGLPPGRALLLGPPCRDSYSGRSLGRTRFGSAMIGGSIREWLACVRPEQYPGREIGVIAGSLSFGMGRFVARGLPVPNDGVVTVSETELPGAADHIVLPVSHSAMLVSREVARQTAAFLNDGRFARI